MRAFLFRTFLLATLVVQRVPTPLGAQELPDEARLLYALNTGDVDTMAELLRRDPGLAHTRDRDGRPALMLAATHPLEGKLACTRLLLKAGAEPDAVWGESGFTALLAAAHLGPLEVVETLLEHGADPDARLGRDRETALFAAARREELGMLKALMASGADLNARAKNGGTALLAALVSERWTAARLLIDHGADLDLVDDDWGAPLAVAARHGNHEFLATLLQSGASSDPAFPRRGPTPLLAATRGADEALIRQLLTAGADPDAVGRWNYSESALHHAARVGDLETLRLLLEYGADANVLDSEGATPLTVAEDPHARALLEENGALAERPGAPLSSVVMRHGHLAGWGSRQYRMARLPRFGTGRTETLEVGTITLGTEVAGDELLFRDLFDLSLGEKTIRAEIKGSYRPDAFLSLDSVECVSQGAEFKSFRAWREGDLLHVQGQRVPEKIALSAETVALEGLFRLVTLLPREEGFRVVIPSFLETPDLSLRGRIYVTCLGADELREAERVIPCALFAVDGQRGRFMKFWVDEQGVLQRILIDEEEQADLIRE